MYCSNCGKPLDDGVRFCKFCGASTEVAAPAQPKQPNAHPSIEGNSLIKPSKKLGSILVPVLIIIVAAAALWMLKLAMDGSGFNDFRVQSSAPFVSEKAAEEQESTAAVCNLGSDFYAYIYNPQNGCNIENRNGSVRLVDTDKSDPRQIWHFTRQDETSYKITNMYDGRCLDASSSEEGNSVQALAYNGSDFQKWCFYSPTSSGTFYISPCRYNEDGDTYKAHEYVLSTETEGSGSDIQLSANQYGQFGPFSHSGMQNQLFQVNQISEAEVVRLLAYDMGGDFYAHVSYSGSYLQTSGVQNGQYMDVFSNRTFNSTDAKQLWHFIHQSDGSYKIQNAFCGDWVLSVEGASAEKGKTVLMSAADSNHDSQRWYLIYSPGDSTYRIASALSFPSQIWSLDIPVKTAGELATDGMKTTIWEQHENSNQQFSIAMVVE